MPCDIARDANGHVLNRQVWTVGAAPVVTLYFAHLGIDINGIARPPNSFFFRHVMLPSGKVGVTLAQKAALRLTHRQGGQFDVKIREAGLKANANPWAQAQANDGAQRDLNIREFFRHLVGNGLADLAYIAALPNAADWTNLRQAILSSYNAPNAQQQNPGALAGMVNQAANANLTRAESLRVRSAFKSLVDPVRSRAGMSWNTKYGDGAPPENTVLVLSDGKGGGWQADTLPANCQPVTRVLAATHFINTLTGALGAQNAFPVNLAPTVNFGQPCVLTTTANTFGNTMEVQAVACSATEFDIFHFGH